MHDPVACEEAVGDLGRTGTVRAHKVGDELVAVGESTAIDVAFVRGTVDRHGAGDQVVVAAAEVVESLVLLGRNGNDRIDRGCRHVAGATPSRRRHGKQQKRPVGTHVTTVRSVRASHKPV